METLLKVCQPSMGFLSRNIASYLVTLLLPALVLLSVLIVRYSCLCYRFAPPLVFKILPKVEHPPMALLSPTNLLQAPSCIFALTILIYLATTKGLQVVKSHGFSLPGGGRATVHSAKGGGHTARSLGAFLFPEITFFVRA